MKQYRLLNEDEVIQPKDEQLSASNYADNGSNAWNDVFSSIGRRVGDSNFTRKLYRRPIANEWIPITERKPTKEDADFRGFVIARWNDGSIGTIIFDLETTSTRWMRISDFPQELDPFEQAWKELGSHHCVSDFLMDKNEARKLWETAQKTKQYSGK